MRPAGEIRQALLQAVSQLSTPERSPTLAELASHAQVGSLAARRTIDNMKRHGVLRIVRPRRVAYRNRPVAEYALQEETAAETAGYVDLGAVLHAWAD